MISLDEAIAQINKANPFFGSFLTSEEKVLNYCIRHLTRYECDPVFRDRQKGYTKLIREKIDKLFHTEDVRVNYDEPMILDTTDHHNILNFPSIIGAHVMSRFDTIFSRATHGDYYVLDCGNVTFSEVLHKRGVEFGGKHINLYPREDKNRLVSRYPLYQFDFMHWVKNSGHAFSAEQLAFIERMQRMVDEIDFSTCTRFSDQIVKINHRLWLEFFDPADEEDVRRCIGVEHDEILSNYLIAFFQSNSDSIISRALFDQKSREDILREFNGIYGAWNYSGDKTGTHFFWAVTPGDGKERRLELQGDTLVEPSGLIRKIKLKPEDIVAALKEDIITPSIFTKFSLITCYLGAKVMGGPGQTEYVGKIYDAWKRVLKKWKDPELSLLEKVQVLNMNCGDIAFSKTKNGKLFREFGWDVAFNHRFSREYIRKLGQTAFKYTVYPLVPVSYYRLTPANERQEIQYDEQQLYQGFNWVS